MQYVRTLYLMETQNIKKKGSKGTKWSQITMIKSGKYIVSYLYDFTYYRPFDFLHVQPINIAYV